MIAEASAPPGEPVRTPTFDRRRLWYPLLVFLLTRSFVAAIAFWGAIQVGDSPVNLYHLRSPDNVLVDVFGSRWDTGFYVSIAEEGYTYDPTRLSSVAFFPLLPLIMRLVMALGLDTLVAGILIANVALLGATVLLYQLAFDRWGKSVADRTVWYLLLFPASLFGSAIYSESLFLLTAVAAMYLARRGWWESAALVGVFIGLTRLVGVVMAPVLFVEWLVQRRRGQTGNVGVLAAITPLLGFGLFSGYLAFVFGDPLLFARAAASWGRKPASPIAALEDLGREFSGALNGVPGPVLLDRLLDAAFVVAFLAVGFVLLRRREWADGVLVTLGTLMPLSSGILISQRRYVWVLFPVYIVLARWATSPTRDRIITSVFALGLAVLTVMFANSYWVA